MPKPKSSYWQKLQDPRWQKMRLKILERAKFACESCGDETKTLHVHHKLYRKGAEPWEYGPHELVALCEDCHSEDHVWRQRIAEAMARVSSSDLEIICGYVEAMAERLIVFGEDESAVAVPIEVRSWGHAFGVADAFGIPRARLRVERVIDLRPISPSDIWCLETKGLEALEAERKTENAGA